MWAIGGGCNNGEWNEEMRDLRIMIFAVFGDRESGGGGGGGGVVWCGGG